MDLVVGVSILAWLTGTAAALVATLRGLHSLGRARRERGEGRRVCSPRHDGTDAISLLRHVEAAAEGCFSRCVRCDWDCCAARGSRSARWPRAPRPCGPSRPGDAARARARAGCAASHGGAVAVALAVACTSSTARGWRGARASTGRRGAVVRRRHGRCGGALACSGRAGCRVSRRGEVCRRCTEGTVSPAWRAQYGRLCGGASCLAPAGTTRYGSCETARDVVSSRAVACSGALTTCSKAAAITHCSRDRAEAVVRAARGTRNTAAVGDGGVCRAC